MATLSNTSIKDTYQGLLKTSDAGAVTSTLKTIETGEGTSTALKLATDKVEVAQLQFTTLADGAGDTSVLSVDANNVVRKIAQTTNALSATYSGTAPVQDSTVTLSAGGASTVFQLKGGFGTTVTRTVNNGTQVFTIDTTDVSDATSLTNTTTDFSLTSSVIGKRVFFPMARCKSSSQIKLVLPDTANATTGDIITFVFTGSNPSGTTEAYIDTHSNDTGFKGRVMTSNKDNAESVFANSSGSDNRFVIGSGTGLFVSHGDTVTFTLIEDNYWSISGSIATGKTGALDTPAVFTTQP